MPPAEGDIALIAHAVRRRDLRARNVVEQALRRYLDELARDDKRAQAARLLADLRESLAGGARTAVEELYDDTTGLPA